jgi:hypothetical protein
VNNNVVHDLNQCNDSVKVERDLAIRVPLKINGTAISACLDSGSELTVVNSQKLHCVPFSRLGTIQLCCAFGTTINADLVSLCLQLDDVNALCNDERIFVICALTDKLSQDCLLSYRDYQRLTAKNLNNDCMSCNAVTTRLQKAVKG